jgi:hypothetical protein
MWITDLETFHKENAHKGRWVNIETLGGLRQHIDLDSLPDMPKVRDGRKVYVFLEAPSGEVAEVTRALAFMLATLGKREDGE